MAALSDVQNAYFAINRAQLDAVSADAIVRAIEQGQISLVAYTANLIQKAASTTGAAAAMLSFVTGMTPSSQHLSELKVAADAQLASYQKLGGGNAGLGPFEAFGKALAADPATGFAAKYGALSDAAFIATSYSSVYGREPAAAAAINLKAQVDYFVALYVAAGFPATEAALEAKGAVLGQIIGYAFTDPAAAALTTLDDQVATFLTKAASGDTTIFGAPLPTAAPTAAPPEAPPVPSPVPQTFNFTTADDTISGGTGDDSFIGTVSYAGTLANASSTFNVVSDTIDGGAGYDTVALTASGASPNIDLSAARISNVEKLQVATTAATTTFQLTGTSFIELASSGTGTGGVTFNSFGTSVTKASVTGVAAASNATAGFTPDGGSLTGSTDAFTLTLTNNGSSSSTATINFKPMTGTSGFYETLNLVSAGTANFVTFSTTGQTSLATVNISGRAPLTLGMTGSTEPLRTILNFDASAATGNVTLGASGANGFLGAANQTVKLGIGNDTVFFGPNLDANDMVDGGAGRDTISVNTSGVTAAQLTNVSNFEVLRYEITAAGITQDVSLLASLGLTDIALSGSSSATVQLSNMPTSGITAVNVLNNMPAVTLAQSLANGSGASDALTLRFASTSSSGATLLQVNDVTGLETLNIASGGSASSNTISNNKVSAQQVLTGSVNFGTSASGSGHALTFDASAFTGKLTINGTSTGSGNDTVVLGFGNDVVNMRTGTDTITLGTQGSNAATGFDLIAAVTGSAETVRLVSNTAAGNGAATAYTNGAIHAALIGSVTNTGTGNATGAVSGLTLAFSASNGDFSLTNAAGTVSTGLAKGDLAQGLAAGDTLVVQSVALDDSAAAAITNLAVVKLTTATPFTTDIKGTFAAAIGTASVTGLASDANYLVELYDRTASKTLFAVANTGASDAGDTTLSAADFTASGMAVIVGVSSTSIGSGIGLGLAF